MQRDPLNEGINFHKIDYHELKMRNLQGLTSFLEAATAGSFTAAAERLELSPAAVSKNVIKLETELGVRLFNRHTRRIRLTPEGAAFAEQAREALRALDNALNGVREAQAEPSGRVRISVGSSFGRRYVLPALPALLAQYPKLEIEVSLENRTVDLVAEGFDIGIRGGRIRDSSLIARRVARLPLMLLAAPSYLAQHGTPKTAADLARHELIGVRFNSGVDVWRLRPAPGQPAVDWLPTARLFVSDPEAQVDLAVAGAGIIQVALHHAAADMAAGRLQRVLSDQHEPDEREIVLHYPHRQFLSPRVRVVVDALLAHLAAVPALHFEPDAISVP
jgi:DNA-binding transcriptional LysR family regulator